MGREFDYAMKPVALQDVEITGGFWQERIETNRSVTLPLIYGRYAGKPSPNAKWLEAAAYNLATRPDPVAEQRFEAAVDALADLQGRDGFIGSQKPAERWRNLRDGHVLYGIGHLIEAAVAYFDATGKRRLLDVVCRAADNVAKVFAPGGKQAHGYPGHQEIELALVKLYRATGRQRYLDLARQFLDERGRQPHCFDIEARARGEKPEDFAFKTYQYNQSHLPVREQSDAVGHAVRAMYMYCGMTDVAVLTNDKALLAACKRLWRSVTLKRMHITGGIGPNPRNEGFTADYDLPSQRAYLETCATIGLLLWAQRLLHAEKDGRYADVVERALYNGTISGVSADGKTFFYGNPLAAHPGFDGNGRYVDEGFHYRRSEWFGCACCPPNIARLIAQIPTLLYSYAAGALYVHQYAASTARAGVGPDVVELTQKTDYPWNGRIRLSVTPSRPATWTLALRIPGWCRCATLRVNGRPVKADQVMRKGYACIRRRWAKGDRVELVLPMVPERIEAHPSARQTVGRVALQRGPIVYCLEQADNGANLAEIALPRTAKLSARRDSDLPSRAVVITARGKRPKHDRRNRALYRPAGAKGPATTSVPIKAIPYFLWAHRTPGEMLTWIRDVPG